ncbi:type II toxin-antitoxin system VapC family toxin [Dyadobacter sp. CY261]|uniref:type II toxin-antitoxin system VapC family toxin n=1 Tax=Dyadobacter sp. CY261 TaxID=2907203 RepID=UPI001F3B0A4C|nr:type II toxin-antitoxin system VapC family toxin [Dyadobacter sp. CY261]MCF0074640.1 type II toxin-antitoxin system VapC family toxin [Dyadobacter sp. CY261]
MAREVFSILGGISSQDVRSVLRQGIARVAVAIGIVLKKRGKLIGMADVFIAATAVHHGLPLATLNIKHFERIETLELLV